MTTTSEPYAFGESMPPRGPHNVTFHAPKWEAVVRFREGDMTLLAQLKSIYPRFGPFGVSAQFLQTVGEKIKIPPGRKLAGFLRPEIWLRNSEHAISKFRKEKALTKEDFNYHVVEIDGIRLYLVEFPAPKTMSAIFMWQHGGVGFLTRLAEHLLARLDTLNYLGAFPDGLGAPSPTYLPEGKSHGLVRQRVAELLNHATVQDHAQPVKADDVYLFQTGMAAILHVHDTIIEIKPHPVVVFGAVFHSSWHLFEEDRYGVKHYGKASDADIDDFEQYLESGGECSYVFTEFPSNPILVSVDLTRLRKLADKFGFWLIVDDTIGSFCNIDVLPVADIIITSLSKTFNGYADLLLGSATLNPNLPSHSHLRPAIAKSYHNEVFSGDADQALKNSANYFERSTILNGNAAALVAYFHKLMLDPGSSVAAVCYPPYSPGSQNLLPFLRKSTPEYPEIGYGCLFSVEFASEAHIIAFFDTFEAYNGPHLGAHLTLAMPYNAMIYGKSNPEYHAAYGMSPNQIRISVGLEDTDILLARCEAAMNAVRAVAAKTPSDGHQVTEKLAQKAYQSATLDPVGGKPVDN